jgi:hypothetical protein
MPIYKKTVVEHVTGKTDKSFPSDQSQSLLSTGQPSVINNSQSLLSPVTRSQGLARSQHANQ